MGIGLLDPDNPAEVDQVAALYERHLADSPVVRLGPRFLREFFFRTLVRDGLVGCLVCRHEGQAIAFLSWTPCPGDFISRGVRRHPVRLLRIMLRSLLARPAFLRELLATLRMVSRRAGDAGTAPEDVGAIEAISLVVPPEFQAHVPEGGKGRVTVRLVRALADHARAAGVSRVLYVVQPGNASSALFFNGLGCDMAKRTYAGQEVYVYTHDVGAGAA